MTNTIKIYLFVNALVLRNNRIKKNKNILNTTHFPSNANPSSSVFREGIKSAHKGFHGDFPGETTFCTLTAIYSLHFIPFIGLLYPKHPVRLLCDASLPKGSFGVA